MNRIQKLINAYSLHIAIPWRADAAPPQRVIFCVYDTRDERILRANLAEFEIATGQAGHLWRMFDLRGTFAAWLVAQKYAEKYFQNPANLNSMALARYLDWLVENFERAVPESAREADLVVALTGVAEVFGFFKVKSLLDKLAPKIAGRLVVFFPGSRQENNYRLLDAYDGWNYHATSLTADM